MHSHDRAGEYVKKKKRRNIGMVAMRTAMERTFPRNILLHPHTITHDLRTGRANDIPQVSRPDTEDLHRTVFRGQHLIDFKFRARAFMLQAYGPCKKCRAKHHGERGLLSEDVNQHEVEWSSRSDAPNVIK